MNSPGTPAISLPRLAAAAAAFSWLVVPLQFQLVNHLGFSPLLFLWLAAATACLAAAGGALYGWVLGRLRKRVPLYVLVAAAVLLPLAGVYLVFLRDLHASGAFERRAEVVAQETMQAWFIAAGGFLVALLLGRRLRAPLPAAAGLLAAFVATGILAQDAEPSLRTKDEIVRSLEKDAPSAGKLLLFAADGLDWRVVNDLVARGELPHFAALMERGAAAHLQTMVPTLSPIIWTTMATGTSWREHGVHDFIYYDLPGAGRDATPTGTYLSRILLRISRKNPVVRNYIRLAGTPHRQRLTFWEVLDLAGQDCLTVNWWATFPPAGFGGRVASDIAVELAMKRAIERDASADPARKAELQAEMEDFLPGAVNDPGLAADIVAELTPEVLAARFEEARGLLAGTDFGLPEGLPAKQVERFVRALVHGEIVRRAVARGTEDVWVYYDRLPDQTSHLFWQFYQPDEPVYGENAPSPEAVAGLREMVPAAYRTMDAILGKLLEAAGADIDVVIVSDHGFTAIKPARKFQFGRSEENPARSGHHHHAEPGVFLMAGPQICAGRPLEEVTIFDLAPTLLHMRGLPLAENLPGRAVVEAYCEEWMAEHPVRTVPTYEFPDWRRRQESMQAGKDQIKDLAQLGYLGAD